VNVFIAGPASPLLLFSAFPPAFFSNKIVSFQKTIHCFEVFDDSREYKHQSSNKTSLKKGLEKEVTGDFLKLCVGLVTPTLKYKVHCLTHAVEGLGTRESTLIDVFCQSSNFELAELAKIENLRKKVFGDISGDFLKIIEEMYQANRPEQPISDSQAQELAHEFYKAGEGKIGTDEKKYILIITRNSVTSLKQINHHYKHKHKHSLKKAIESETSGDLKNALIALTKTRPAYFADRLHNAMKGVGTNERVLTYVFSTLDRGELLAVAEHYQNKYKKRLADSIASETSGDYKKLLLALLG